MQLQKVLIEPIETLIYLERFVNDGSPSGFTHKYTTTREYDPFIGVECFRLPLVHIPFSQTRIYGKVSSNDEELFFDTEGNVIFPLHPDCFNNNCKLFQKNRISESSFHVCPTSSGRTVFVIKEEKMFYLKLHYDRILCRAKRNLPFRKAVAGVEISDILKKYIKAGFFQESFSIFLESFSINAELNNSDFGFVFREGNPFPYKRNILPIIPFFSLTGSDIKKPSDDLLLIQILLNFDDKKEMLLERIIFPILSFYVVMIKQLGLTPELNAQNILLELNEKAEPSRVIIRDHMGTEKDITLRKELGLSTNFVSHDYKIIDRYINEKLYFIRHSFHYDFKLCKYVIEPILRTYSRAFGEDLEKLIELTKEKFISEIGNFRFNYFKPYNKWYSHPKIQFEGERPYISHSKTKYR